jgi:O-6-methylguanine DNA methyltransferase
MTAASVKIKLLDYHEQVKTSENHVLYWGDLNTELGKARIVCTENQALCALLFFDNADSKKITEQILQRRWLVSQKQQNQEHVELAWHKAHQDELNLCLDGTQFQKQVWQALLTIPAGQTTTYQEIANQINKSKAVRAVGSAIGSNPVSWLIPCHRVIRSDGGLGGYLWGLKKKQQLLDYERKS